MESEPITISNIEGKVIDNFQIMELFSTGGFSKVHFARHIPTNCYCAAKIVDLSKQNTSTFNGMMKEISVYMQVSHPRIVTLYRFSLVSKILIFFLQYAPNGTLLNYVNRQNGLKENEARRLFLQLFDTIRYIHIKHFLVHRDLKLENILLDKDNNILLTDFGLSDTFYNTTLKSTVGTPGYMPPEVLAGSEYNEKCDVWSLGVCLYLMIAGRLPFSATNDFRLLKSQAENIQFPEFFSQGLVDLLRKMLTPTISERPSIEKLFSHRYLTGIPPISMNFMPTPIIFYRINNIADILKFRRSEYNTSKVEETIEQANQKVKEIRESLAEEASKPKIETQSPEKESDLRVSSSAIPIHSEQSEPNSPKSLANSNQVSSNCLITRQNSTLSMNNPPKARCSSIKGHRRSNLSLKELSMERNSNRNSSHDFRSSIDKFNDFSIQIDEHNKQILSPFANKKLHISRDNLSHSGPSQRIVKNDQTPTKSPISESFIQDDEILENENNNENDEEKDKNNTKKYDDDFNFTFEVDIEELKKDLTDGKINENTTGFFLLLHSCFKKPDLPKNQNKKVKINQKLGNDNKLYPHDKKLPPTGAPMKANRFNQNNAMLQPRVIEPKIKPKSKPTKRIRTP